MTANGGMSTQTPARRAPMRINTHKRATTTAAISSSSRDSVSGRITPSSFHSESEFDSDNEALRSASRRSKRNRPVDPSRDLIVIHPDEDISDVLGVTGTDLDEFLDMCNEGPEWGHGTKSALSASNVYTPLVSTIGNSSAHGKEVSRKSKKLPPRVKTDSSLRPDEVFERLKQPATYFDYDVDSEDELFLSQLADDTHCSSSARSSKKAAVKAISGTSHDPITADQLEIIFNLLERELEIARKFHKQLDGVKQQYSDLIGVMKDIREVMTALSVEDQSSSSRKGSNSAGLYAKSSRIAAAKKNSKKKSAGDNELPYRSGIISEALEICNRNLAAARSTLEVAAATPSGPAEVVIVGSVAVPSAIEGDLLMTPAPRRRGRPPLHSRPLDPATAAIEGASTNKGSSKDEDDPEFNLPPFYSEAELREMVPWSVAEAVIRHALPDLFSKPPKSASGRNAPGSLDDIPILGKETDELIRRASDTRLVLSPVYRVYEYWLGRRCLRRTSFLRGFHVFLMENWKATAALGTAIAPNTKETLKVQLNEARVRLLRLRADLDRARLIMDLVRKREKLKKMMFRNSCETFDDYLSPAEDPTAESAPLNKKRKKGSAGAGAASTIMHFYQDGFSEEESSDGDSECTDDYDDTSSEEEAEDVAPPVKRSRANDNTTGGDHLAHLDAKPTGLVYGSGSGSATKRVKTQLVTEPVLARLPQPAKTATRVPSSGGGGSQLHHSSKNHVPTSASKAAIPCSLQNASMSKHSSSSSLGSSEQERAGDRRTSSFGSSRTRTLEAGLPKQAVFKQSVVESAVMNSPNSAPSRATRKAPDSGVRSLRSDPVDGTGDARGLQITKSARTPEKKGSKSSPPVVKRTSSRHSSDTKEAVRATRSVSSKKQKK